MNDFEIIDVHTHLARNQEEEANYFLVPGRRACDRFGTPDRAIEYMDRAGISKMAFMTLIPRQFRGPLLEKTMLPGLPKKDRLEKEKSIGEKVAPLMREFNQWGCEVGKRLPRLLPFSCISKEFGDADAIAKEVELYADQGASIHRRNAEVAIALRPNDEALVAAGVLASPPEQVHPFAAAIAPEPLVLQ